MPIVGNRVYSDPNIGAAFSNLAGMFAPPDSGDMANYALAKGRNQSTDIINKLRTDPRYTGFDHQAILADLFDPSQSFYAVDEGEKTARRGQDITASTSRANNAADNQRAFLQTRFGPLSQGEVMPAVPSSISSLFDIPEALPMAAGAPKPMSETEWQAAQNERLHRIGLIKDEDLVAAVNSDIPVEQTVGPNGEPVFTRRSDAVGQTAYVNKGAEAKPENMVAVLSDGKTQVPAIQGPDGGWYNAQTKERLPDDIRIFKVPQAQGTAEDVGLSKPTDTYIEKQLIDIGIAKDTAIKLRDLIASKPASQGLVGWLRGTAQNVIQTGGELGQFFGGNVAEVAKDIENGLADADLAGAFDPNIPAIDMLANLLAFQYAKTTTGERLSNEMLRASREALGLNGLDANQANSIARLNQAIAQIESQENTLRRVLQDGIGSASTPAGPAPAAPGGDEIARPQTEADYNALPSGAMFVDPDDGKTYRKP